MAFINHKMTLLFISAFLISTLSVEALLAPAPAPSPADTVEVNLSDLKLPDVSETVPDTPSADSQSKVANTVSKQMQVIQQKLDEFSQILKKRSEDPATSHMAQECIAECNEVIGAAVDDIKKSLESLGTQDLNKANFDVSAVSTNVDTCSECFIEMGDEDPEIKKIDDWVRGITDDALVSLETASS